MGKEKINKSGEQSGKNASGKGKAPVRPKNKTQDAEAILRKLLKEKGFSYKEPELSTAFLAFREMSRLAFNCAEDELLFEAGCYDYDGRKLFCVSLVRQFTVIEEEGEFDYIEQLNMDLLYEVTEQVKELSETVWSYEFENVFDKFFEEVEKKDGFRMALKEMKPAAVDLYMDEV